MSAKPSGDYKKQYRKAVEEEELVKYMSNLPSYLERSKSRQEKVLNFGVLDWGRLEKWQSQKHIPHRSCMHSLSSSNSSSSFSTEGSSVHSSRGQSCSPTLPRMRCPSLQSHVISSPGKGCPEVNRYEECIRKSPDFKGIRRNTANERGKFIRAVQPSKNCSGPKLAQEKMKDSDPKIKSGTRTMADRVNYEALMCMNMTTETLDVEFSDRPESFQELGARAVDQYVSKEGKPVVLMPRNLPKPSHSGMAQFSKSTAIGAPVAAEARRMSFSDISEEVGLTVISPNIPHSCPLPQESELNMKQCSDARDISLLPGPSRKAQHPAKVGIGPSCSKISQVQQSTTAIATTTSKESSMGLEQKPNKVAAEKARCTSPFRRLSIGMGKISKSFTSKEASLTQQLNVNHNSVKTGSENAMNSFYQDASVNDLQNNASRARSSPLRRLLEPLLKPKAPLERDFVSKDKACKSSDVKTNVSDETAQPGIVKRDMTRCQATDFSDPVQDKKFALSQFQALLRVSVKNGQPLYTFAVDNEHDILAATMKKLSASREDDYNCIYTFFSIQEVRKKNGTWINQGGKCKGQDYISNVAAQLKVSGSQFSRLTRQKYIGQSFAREFVLFAVDLQQAEQRTSNSQPNDELAAIVVKIPGVINRSTVRDGHQSHKFNDLPETRFGSTWENGQNQPTIGFQSLINVTVILPSGIHSLPSKGGPSSLIQRWRSGGTCDCGGWDLGCKLRILSNPTQLSKKSTPSRGGPVMEKFEFVFQGEGQNQPVFSLIPFKDGIYSVKFSSLLSVLQAFSLCIAVLDGKELCEAPESRTLLEEKTSLETILSRSDGIRARNGTEGEVPPRCISYPSLSPVGRV